MPDAGYLQYLREVCTQHGAVLIFDEVMTGFRLAQGGVQELEKIVPDLTCLGKIIGGGLPVGAFGGRADIMDCLAPLGPVLSGRHAQRQSARHGRRHRRPEIARRTRSLRPNSPGSGGS